MHQPFDSIGTITRRHSSKLQRFAARCGPQLFTAGIWVERGGLREACHARPAPLETLCSFGNVSVDFLEMIHGSTPFQTYQLLMVLLIVEL